MQHGNLIILKQEKSELLVYVFFIKECYSSCNRNVIASHKQHAVPAIERIQVVK